MSVNQRVKRENQIKSKSVSLILLLQLIKVTLSPISTANLQMAISTFILSHFSVVTQNLQLFLVRLLE